MKNSKGITLVALVVTIIVLLILAGVSLSLVAGGDGIITRASNAADTNYEKSAQEAAELLIANASAEYYEYVYAGGTPSFTVVAGTEYTLPSYVAAYINAHNTVNGGTLSATASNITLTVSQTGNKFTATWDGTKLGDWKPAN